MRDHSLAHDGWHLHVSDARKKKGITQQRLAVLTGIHQPRISQIENGEVDPKLSEVGSIAQALNLAMVLFQATHLESVNLTIRDCEILDDELNGPPTIPQLVLRAVENR